MQYLNFSGLRLYDIQYRYQTFLASSTALAVCLLISVLTGKNYQCYKDKC